ncbi:N-alpha-acetyltransferase 50 [Thoreauomyces humboldtii]|nr:N-alpha-acetyltransferase 50 [Thoreauomyces humboldtii]
MTTTETQPEANSKLAAEKAKYFRKDLNDLTPNNVGQLKALNNVIFPEKRNDSFYTDAIKSEQLSKLALFNDVCVGGVVATREGKTITIVTLGVLVAYRRLGLGTMLLDHIIAQCEAGKDKTAVSELLIQVDKKEAGTIAFLQKREFTPKEGSTDVFTRVIVSSAPTS